jgi:gliding motility-associated-like protein
MKKFAFLFFILTGFAYSAKADHITGGEMFYTFAGVEGGGFKYHFTLKLFMRCNSGRQFNNPNTISIFNRSTNTRVRDMSVPLSHTETISLDNAGPCIDNPPTVCYVIGIYIFDIILPSNAEGYLVVSQVNFRINSITNLTPGYSNIGATYAAQIPGTASLPTAPTNNSANFVDDDLVVVCATNSFQYNFEAVDLDGDQLRYSFCNAWQTQTSGNGGAPSSPPYSSVPYGNGFSGGAPLGNSVQINPNTGLITGIAPVSGIYVVTVCVEEIRNGVVIATQRKDLQIFIAPCTIAAASLPDEYMLCDQSMTVFMENQSNSPLISTYYWEVQASNGSTLFTASTPTPNFTFADTGLYYIKLIINRGQECSDSTVSPALVYPGFKPAFDINGICFTKPTAFTDRTTSVYGMVNSWKWDFGEASLANDISADQHPVYTYPAMGIKNVMLITTNSKGCRDTVIKQANIFDKPPIDLSFRDTLICIPDAVRLIAGGSGIFSWSPSAGMDNSNSATPTVAPRNITTYYVQLNDNGCINTDSVKVRVTDHVDLQAMNDTLICATDTIRLRSISNGFQYSWTPAIQCLDPFAKNPLVVTNNTTTYQVTARIGSCTATDQVVVKTVPYPLALAGRDTTICFGTTALLNGHTDGNAFIWTPATSLSNAFILNPVAYPAKTTAYVLAASDTRGCPKQGRDTVIVNVLPDISAFAGRDTVVVVGQPLQLQATGGNSYQWVPSTGLSSPNVANPVAVYNASIENIRYKVIVSNEEGCADSAFVNVRVFKTKPTVFVPTAFTPNGDGRNDRLMAVAVGFKQVEYFKVYNRWGELVYSSGANGPGWDGKINGQVQVSSTYVWIIKAIDYTGGAYFEKGLTTLIR